MTLKKVGLILCFVLSFSIVKAQDGLTSGTPITKSVGASNTIKVNADGAGPYTHKTDHAGNLYTWEVLKVVSGVESAAGGDVSLTLASDFTTALPASVDVANLFQVGVVWNVAGDYIVEVTETNQQTGQGNCTTKRRFFVKVTNQMDVALVALKSDEVTIITDDADRISCTDASGNIIDNITPDYGTSTRYYKVTMSTGSSFNPAWSFDFTLATISATVKSVSVTGETVTFTENGTTGNIAVSAGVSEIVVAVEMNNTVAVLQTLDFSIDDTSAKYTSGGVEYVEALDQNGNNSVKEFTINPMPNTSVISFD